jgi:hypothetical protein
MSQVIVTTKQGGEQGFEGRTHVLVASAILKMAKGLLQDLFDSPWRRWRPLLSNYDQEVGPTLSDSEKVKRRERDG